MSYHDLEYHNINGQSQNILMKLIIANITRICAYIFNRKINNTVI